MVIYYLLAQVLLVSAILLAPAQDGVSADTVKFSATEQVCPSRVTFSPTSGTSLWPPADRLCPVSVAGVISN